MLPFAALLLFLSACSGQDTGNPVVPGADAAHSDLQWVKNGFDDMAQRFAPVSQMTPDNVDKLGLAWTYQDFIVRGRVHRGNQGTPLVIDDVMYFTGPWSVVYAVDAKTGEELWVYDPEAEGAWARRACCDVNNKGVAYEDGVLYVGVVDGYLDAIDAGTGKRIWRTNAIPDRTRSYTVTGAPRIAGDKIIIGAGGGDMDVRGFFAAFDKQTGEQAWIFYTVPASPEQGDETTAIMLARKTWGDDARWDLGLGGAVYDSIVYDPDLNMVYAGVGNGVPHPTWLRDPTYQGDNLFLSSIVAVDADTGDLKWHYQTTPADDWDFGATQNMILADLDIDGQSRKVLMQAPKNGFFYVLDRETGELISAEPFTTVTWASHVDMETGRPVLDPDLKYDKGPKVIWPSVSGGHNWQPMAFSPKTGLVYIPVLEAPMKYVGYDGVEYQPASLNEGKGPPLMPPFDEADAGLVDGQPEPTVHSVLKAWDPVSRKTVWQSEYQPWWSGGVLVTEGNLVFQGAPDGLFRVYDASSGELLKSIDLGIAILAPPMTYMIDGKQYVAVQAGLGGSESAYFPDQAAAHKYENPESVFVFKLDGELIEMPPVRLPEDKQPVPDPIAISALEQERGAELFYHNCARCHSYRGSPGSYPNLWNMTPSAHDNFMEILMQGQFAFAGMAAFDDVLTPEDAEAIHAFLVNDLIAMEEEGNQATGTRFQDVD